MEENKKVKKRKKKKIIKAPKVQTIFCLISLLFVLGCCFYYGSRLIKYYKIYNPKSESGETLVNLASSIITGSSIVYEGDGLYISSGNYLYKGLDVNNYILVDNMLFRIIRINTDKTIEIILDDYINKKEWDTDIKDFSESSLSKYLEDKFLNIIDKDLLVKSSVCTDTIPELSEVTCEKISNDTYVKLLGISDFLNSISDDKTYLIKDKEYLWLTNHGKTNVWHTSGISVANSSPTKMYGVKPVLTLKNSTVLLSGNGTKDNPYQIQENKQAIKVGTYLDINDEIYIVYDIGDDYYKVESDKVLKNIIFDKTSNKYSDSSLKKYLDNYVESLDIDKLLVDVSFQDNTSKIGLLSLDDFKFDDSLKNYYLSDTKDKEVYLYNGSLLTSKVNVSRNVRFGLGITKDLKIISGNGSKIAPYIVEGKDA